MESDWYFYHLNRQIHILRSSLQATHRVDYIRKASRAVLIIKRCKTAEPREGSMFAFLRCIDDHGSSHTTPLLLNRAGYTEPKVGQEHASPCGIWWRMSVFCCVSVMCRSGAQRQCNSYQQTFSFFAFAARVQRLSR